MIRPVRRDELDALLSIARTTFIETFAQDNSPEDIEIYSSRAFTRGTLLSEYDNPDSCFYFADIDGKIGGYLKLNRGSAQTEAVSDNALEIERIYVSSEMQGRKLGKALFNFAIDEAQRQKCDWMWLGVWENNQKAIEFYTRQGLKPFGEHSFLFGNTPQRDLLMRMKIS